jgi:hypothetical protein
MRRAASHSAPFGIMKRYKDALGNWRQTPPDTYAAIVETMSQEIAEKDAPLLVVRRG